MHNIFDSHAHYNDERFDPDRHEVLSAMPEKGVAYILNAGCDLASTQAGLALSQQYSFVYASAGIHPHEAKDAPADYIQQLGEIAQNNAKICAIGEIGLDYHYDFSPREVQKQVFEAQLVLAKELDMPVIIHDREAHADTMELLQKYRPRGIVHCYSGSAEMAKEIIKLGMYIGFTGVVTFKNARKTLEAAAAVPLERLLVETDSPYMSPEPFRGKRCDSSLLPYVIQALAAVKETPPQQLADITCQNAKEIYGIA